jgi:flagellar biosynthesis/type III secretory pathway protein FliH
MAESTTPCLDSLNEQMAKVRQEGIKRGEEKGTSEGIYEGLLYGGMISGGILLFLVLRRNL